MLRTLSCFWRSRARRPRRSSRSTGETSKPACVESFCSGSNLMEVEIETKNEKEGPSSKNKRIGLMIALMAGCLAFSEMAARNAANDVIRETVEASDTWSFYQAKTIRAAMLRADAKALQVQAAGGVQGPQATQLADTVKEWEAT